MSGLLSPAAWVFALGLLLPIYTITGYDASAHTSEETVKAPISVPRGMVSSVLWASIFGYIMLCSFVLMIPNMDDAAKQGWNVFFWAMDTQVNQHDQDGALRCHLHFPVPLRAGDGDIGFAHDLCVLA